MRVYINYVSKYINENVCKYLYKCPHKYLYKYLHKYLYKYVYRELMHFESISTILPNIHQNYLDNILFYFTIFVQLIICFRITYCNTILHPLQSLEVTSNPRIPEQNLKYDTCIF